jgi:hypothetical protein
MAGVETRVDEDRLIRDLLAGEWSDLTQERGYDPQCKPILAAALLKRLVLGRDPRAHNLPAGARIRGVRLDGDLDLADCYGPQGGGLGVLALEECDLPGRINVSNTELARLSIRKSRFRELWGEGVQVRGDLDFRESSPLPTDDASIPGSAYIRLRAAEIGGDVWGRGATLRSPPEVPEGLTVVPPALQLWLAKIGGSLSFEMRFDCSGEFKINGATIGGDLSLDGARLSNPDGMALDAAGARIGGEATFHTEGEHRFEAEGEVRLSNASIGRNCEFMGARLSNPGGDALDASGCTIGGHLGLVTEGDHRFESEGRLFLFKAEISGDLYCGGARLSNPGGAALSAYGVRVGGNAWFNTNGEHRFEAEGEVLISDGNIGRDCNLSGARLGNPKGDPFGAGGCTIGGDLTLASNGEHRFESEGRLFLHKAKISGDLSCGGARLSNPGGAALSAYGIQVGGNAWFNTNGEHRFEAEGEVFISDGNIGYDCNLSGARLSNPKGDALDASRCSIGGGLILNPREQSRCEVEGRLLLADAIIKGKLDLDGSHLSNPDDIALSASGVQIGGQALFNVMGEHRFEADGEVRLWNGSIGRDCEFMGARLSNPGGDALDANGCTIGGHLRLMSSGNHRFESQGKVLLWNARVSSDLVCGGSHLSNPNDIALGAAGIQIGGNALLLSKNDHRFEAEGGFVISGATIGGDLALSGARLSSPERDALDASGCSIGGKLHAHDNLIGGDVDLSATRTSILGSFAPSAWDGADRIRLDGIGISQIQVDPEDGVPWKQRRNWLRRSSFREHGGRLIVSPHPWRECASAFARSGRHSDARRLQREGYREENRARPKWQQPFVWLFAETPFGFGLSIFRTTVTVLCFWLVGTVGVEVMSARGVLIETNEDGLQRACQSVVAPLYALDVAIPFIDLRQEFRCDPGDMGQAGLFAGIAIPAVSLPGPSTIDATSSSTIRMFDEVTVWHWAKAIYAFLGALVVGFAAVTYSGVFKPKE